MSFLWDITSTTDWDNGHFDEFYKTGSWGLSFPSTRRVAGGPVIYNGIPYGLIDEYENDFGSWDYHGTESSAIGGIYNLASGELVHQIANGSDYVHRNPYQLLYYKGCFYYFSHNFGTVSLIKYDIEDDSTSVLDTYSQSHYHGYYIGIIDDDGYLYYSYFEHYHGLRSGDYSWEDWLTCKKLNLSTEAVTTIDSKTKINSGGLVDNVDGYWNHCASGMCCTDADYYYVVTRELYYGTWRYAKKDGTSNGWVSDSYVTEGTKLLIGSNKGFAIYTDPNGNWIIFFSGGSSSSTIALAAGISADLGGGYILNSSDPYYVLLFKRNSTTTYLVEIDVGNQTNTLKETYTGPSGASCSAFWGGCYLFPLEDIDSYGHPIEAYGYGSMNGFFPPYGETL